MEKRAILLIFLLCSLNVQAAKKKTHPGCAIWWFFPGCPLAKLFGPDPFNIYPWKKFCKKYSSIETSAFCDKEKEKEVVDLDLDLGVDVEPLDEAQSRSEEPIFRRPRNPFKRLQYIMNLIILEYLIAVTTE